MEGLRSRKSSELHPSLLPRAKILHPPLNLFRVLILFERIKKEGEAVDLGAQRQTEIQLGTDRNQARAKMNSALPYIDPHLGAKTPGVAVLPHVPPPAWPHSTGPHTSCWSASPRRPALCLFPSLACWSQSSLCPTSSCLSSQGFRLRVERVTSRRTCLQKAQPYPGLAPQPDSRRLCTKAPLFPRPPDAPNALGIRSLSFPSFIPYRPILQERLRGGGTASY